MKTKLLLFAAVSILIVLTYLVVLSRPVKSGSYTATIDLNKGLTVLTIPHHLGYIPKYQVIEEFGSEHIQLPEIGSVVAGTPPNATVELTYVITASADSKNLYITWEDGSATGNKTVTFKYFLFR